MEVITTTTTTTSMLDNMTKTKLNTQTHKSINKRKLMKRNYFDMAKMTW